MSTKKIQSILNVSQFISSQIEILLVKLDDEELNFNEKISKKYLKLLDRSQKLSKLIEEEINNGNC